MLVPIDGLHLAIEDHGPVDAPAIVLLHGYIASSRCWRNLIPALTHAGFRAITIDALGNGDSDRCPTADPTLAASARRVLAVMDHLNLSVATLLATSYGGAVALQCACLAPQRVRRLILAAPAHPYVAGPRRTAAAYNTVIGKALAHTYPFVPRSIFRRGMATMFADPARCTHEIAAIYRAPMRRAGTIRCLLGPLQTFGSDMDALARGLRRIAHIPARMIWGDRDNVVPLSTADLLMCRFSDAKLEVLPSVGHIAYEEAPQEFQAAVLRALAA